ncbi:hypothetical protein SKAU_G00065220 [Synaphobranchus kaupii]|uniref:Uncharacterized protein n=1 Tax=Synaphobranchus kaupii TaxID=118154 RepID=A0A9Q1G6Q5_SYNKA|nr:hypothetical protein SKAU_G00065220 [Synaphobranchus kaupii]
MEGMLLLLLTCARYDYNHEHPPNQSSARKPYKWRTKKSLAVLKKCAAALINLGEFVFRRGCGGGGQRGAVDVSRPARGTAACSLAAKTNQLHRPTERPPPAFISIRPWGRGENKSGGYEVDRGRVEGRPLQRVLGYSPSPAGPRRGRAAPAPSQSPGGNFLDCSLYPPCLSESPSDDEEASARASRHRLASPSSNVEMKRRGAPPLAGGWRKS